VETRQKSPVDRSGPALREIAGAAVAHSSGTGRCQQSTVCQPRMNARSASAPSTGANSPAYSNVACIRSK
jgi:hypothetical protein